MSKMTIKVREAKKNEADYGAMTWTVTVEFDDNGKSVRKDYVVKAHNRDSAIDQAKLKPRHSNPDAKNIKVTYCKLGESLGKKRSCSMSKKNEKGTTKIETYDGFDELLGYADAEYLLEDVVDVLSKYYTYEDETFDEDQAKDDPEFTIKIEGGDERADFYSEDIFYVHLPNKEAAEELAKVLDGELSESKKPEAKKSEGISDMIDAKIDYNMFMRMCKTAAYLEEDEDYWDALWEYYSDLGSIGDALVFFDNLFQYTAWKDVDETYDELKDEYKDESHTKEECIDKAIDEGALDGVYPYGDHYLWVY